MIEQTRPFTVQDGVPMAGRWTIRGLVSVPWCVAHDSPQAMTDERSYPFCVESAHVQYSERVDPLGAVVGPCDIRDGVVWKVVTE